MRLPTVADIEARIPRPEDFGSRARGAGLTARVGTALGVCFTICFLTGLWSHIQYATPGWLTLSPRPTYLYSWTQGAHVISGTAAIPLLLVKLWSVFPRLFVRRVPGGRGAMVVTALERISIALLVGSSIFLLVTGTLNIIGWYAWDFSFRPTHSALAWVAIGSLLVHIAVKLPTIRQSLGEPIDDGRPDDPDAPTRRTVLRGAFIASGLAVVLTAGQSVPWLRRVSAFSVRPGDGPQDLPINRTARAAGTATTALDPAWVLQVSVGDEKVSLTRDDLLAMPQSTHRLPIACVEGWTRSAEWTGVPLRDVIALLGAAADSDVVVGSLQTRGAFGSSRVIGNVVRDPRTLLALKLNGETLDVDHGYPCRLIAPNRPGVFQTKWVDRLEVRA